MAMSAEERKELIALGKKNEKIAEAQMEEKRILAKKPVYRMTPEPKLKFMKKADAVKLLNAKREGMAAGVALLGGIPPGVSPEATKAKPEPRLKNAKKADAVKLREENLKVEKPKKETLSKAEKAAKKAEKKAEKEGRSSTKVK